MTDHERFREWAAAYVLDALEANERREFELHLAECGQCRADVSSMAPLPGMLGRMDASELEPAPPAIADRAVAAVRSEWRSISASRNRWRIAAGLAAVLAVVVWLAAPDPAPPPEPPDAVLLIIDQSVGGGEIAIDRRGWGTYVEIQLSDVPVRDEYIAWAVTADGRRQTVATWGPTASGGVRVSGASSFFPEDLAEIVITSAAFDDRLVTAVPEEPVGS